MIVHSPYPLPACEDCTEGTCSECRLTRAEIAEDRAEQVSFDAWREARA